MTAGLAIVLTHNVWVANWPVLITVLGWLAAIGGAVRIVDAAGHREGRPRDAQQQARACTIAGAVWLALGAMLCYFGYISLTTTDAQREQNNERARSQIRNPQGHHRPAAVLEEDLCPARHRAGPEGAGARDHAVGRRRRAERAGLRHHRPLHRPERRDQRREGPRPRPHRLGEGARRRRGIRRPRRSSPRTTAMSPASTPRASIRS